MAGGRASRRRWEGGPRILQTRRPRHRQSGRGPHPPAAQQRGWQRREGREGWSVERTRCGVVQAKRAARLHAIRQSTHNPSQPRERPHLLDVADAQCRRRRSRKHLVLVVEEAGSFACLVIVICSWVHMLGGGWGEGARILGLVSGVCARGRQHAWHSPAKQAAAAGSTTRQHAALPPQTGGQGTHRCCRGCARRLGRTPGTAHPLHRGGCGGGVGGVIINHRGERLAFAHAQLGAPAALFLRLLPARTSTLWRPPHPPVPRQARPSQTLKLTICRVGRDKAQLRHCRLLLLFLLAAAASAAQAFLLAAV